MWDPRSALSVEPFTIAVTDEVLADLRARIRNARWPEAVEEPELLARDIAAFYGSR